MKQKNSDSSLLPSTLSKKQPSQLSSHYSKMLTYAPPTPKESPSWTLTLFSLVEFADKDFDFPNHLNLNFLLFTKTEFKTYLNRSFTAYASQLRMEPKNKHKYFML